MHQSSYHLKLEGPYASVYTLLVAMESGQGGPAPNSKGSDTNHTMLIYATFDGQLEKKGEDCMHFTII